MSIRKILLVSCAAFAFVFVSHSLSAEAPKSVKKKARTVAVQASSKKRTEKPSLEFFQAMKDGVIEVKLIPKDMSNARLIIKNKTKQPVRIQAPEAFAGVPVLAQFGGNQGGGGFGGNQGGQQGIGGGGGGFGGGGFGGGGQFSIPPERALNIKYKTVCLDHGKADPNPKIPYEIKPIESYVDSAEVIETVKALGRGEVHLGAAQAAVWHMNSNVSWKELSTKMRGPKDPRFGKRTPYFSRFEMRSAVSIVEEAKRRVKAKGETKPTKPTTTSPGELLQGEE